MNEILIQVAITVAVSVAILGGFSWFIPAARKRLYELPDSDDHGVDSVRAELEQLKKQHQNQQAQHQQDLQRWQAERMQLYQRIVEYSQRIDTLEKKVADLQQKNTALEMQIGSRDGKHIAVLGIWSGENLNVMAERDAIYNAGFAYKGIYGEQVTRAKILSELRTGKYAIIEIGTHGNADAILVNKLELNAGWWQQALHKRGVRVAVVLACFSDDSVTDAMKRAGVAHVIGVDGEIDDTAAIEFAEQFYQLFASGLPVEKAFSEAKLALDYRQSQKLVLK